MDFVLGQGTLSHAWIMYPQCSVTDQLTLDIAVAHVVVVFLQGSLEVRL